MQSLGTYISRRLASFAAFMLLLAALNIAAYALVFYGTVTRDYAEQAPVRMLETVAASATAQGIPQQMLQRLDANGIWAMLLGEDGQRRWAVHTPPEIPARYTLTDVAVFSRGYIADYPVFSRGTQDGLLVLGYPKDSYTKLTGNYYPMRMIRMLPAFAVGMLATDILLLLGAYLYSKRAILRRTQPITEAIKGLAEGKSCSLDVQGELSEIARSVNQAAAIVSRQRSARANWISGVSHDIRTPLSMVMGYAQRIADDGSASEAVRGQAEIVRRQSVRISELIRDLNAVSQLEYEMQPLQKEQIRLAKLLRSEAAEVLNAGLEAGYALEVDVAPQAEAAVAQCDGRLITRAIGNLVQNSIRHNPQGCKIRLSLTQEEGALLLAVEDDGVGISGEKLREMEHTPHYLESLDQRLDLRHGLGLLLVRRIMKAHGGQLVAQRGAQGGARMVLRFPGETPLAKPSG